MKIKSNTILRLARRMIVDNESLYSSHRPYLTRKQYEQLLGLGFKITFTKEIGSSRYFAHRADKKHNLELLYKYQKEKINAK